MAKFQNKINELELQFDSLSKAIKNDINEYLNAEKELEELKSSLQNANDEEKESIEDDINELKEVLNDFDNLIIQKIEKFNKNKGFYDERMKNMAQGRERAKQAKLQNQSQPPLQVQNQSQPPLQGTVTLEAKNIDKTTLTQQKVETQVKNNTEENPKEEKSDWSWLIIAGIVGAVTLGAVILRKK
jgi:hypothetical protein